MEYKTLEEKRKELGEKTQSEHFRELFFEIPKEQNFNLNDLVNLKIIIHAFHTYTFNSKDGERTIVKFSFPDKPEDFKTFITGSVLADRLKRDENKLPFICKIIKQQSLSNPKHKYICYE